MSKREAFKITLNHGGPTVSENGLKLFLKLESDDISVRLDPNGTDLVLAPVAKVQALSYLSYLGKYKSELVALARYVAERERQQDQPSKELKASDIRWDNKAS